MHFGHDQAKAEKSHFTTASSCTKTMTFLMDPSVRTTLKNQRNLNIHLLIISLAILIRINQFTLIYS